MQLQFERAGLSLARWLPISDHNPIGMNNLINIIIVLLLIGWLVGFIGFGAVVGNLIHLLLIVAVVGIIFRLLEGRKRA